MESRWRSVCTPYAESGAVRIELENTSPHLKPFCFQFFFIFQILFDICGNLHRNVIPLCWWCRLVGLFLVRDTGY